MKTAAYGAVTLLSLAYPGAVSAARQNASGATVLTGATGIVGHVLTGKRTVEVTGRSATEVAGQVLPAPTATMRTLQAKAPEAAPEFRRVVTSAITLAAAPRGAGPPPPTPT